MNIISRFLLQTLVAGILVWSSCPGLGFVLVLQFWDAISVTEPLPYPGEAALVSNVDLWWALKHSKIVVF